MSCQADVAVGIVSWNRRQLLAEALRSIQRSTLQPQTVIVIDNNSSDSTQDMLAREFTWVRVVRNKQNLNCIRGRNQIFRMVSNKYTLLLDDDARVAPDCLEKLVSVMERDADTAICGPRLVYPNGEFQASCRTFPTPAAIVMRGSPLGRLFPYAAPLRHYLMVDADLDSPQRVDWMIAACLLVRMSAIRQIGEFDPHFTAHEETDLCARVWKSGWEVSYVPEATCVHHYHRLAAGSWLNRRKLRHIRSCCRLFLKHGLSLRGVALRSRRVNSQMERTPEPSCAEG